MQTILKLVIASRPKTLPISLVPVIVGSALAYNETGTLRWSLVIFALLCALLIQSGINLTNDALDFAKGADSGERLGPVRAAQAGLLSYGQVHWAGLFCFAAAVVFAIPLIVAAGWPMTVALFLSIVFGYLYTGGPYPLAYLGLGELFVFLFFGLLITCTGFYLQTNYIGSASLLAGVQLGLLATVPITINNMRDIDGDRRAGKNTLSVQFGLLFSRYLLLTLSIAPYLLGLFWLPLGKPVSLILPLPAIFCSIHILKQLWNAAPSAAYNKPFVESAQTHTLFGLLLTLSLVTNAFLHRL